MITPANQPQLVWPKWCGLVKQANLWTGELPLYDWQVDVLNAAQVPHSRVAVSTANESGKSSILGVIFLLGVAATFRGANCRATSGNEDQLRGQLFSLLKQRAEQYGWKVLESSMTIVLPNESVIQCTVKSDPRSAEGFHTYWDPRDGGFLRPCAIFIDEGKHVQNLTHDAYRRVNPNFLLAVSTPPVSYDVKYDWFWNAIDNDNLERVVNSRRREYNIPEPKGVYTKTVAEMEEPDPIHSFPRELFTYRRVVPWTECPHLLTPENKNERENIKKKYGENSSFYRSMMLGLATEGDLETPIFNTLDIDHMRSRAMVKGMSKPQMGDTRVAADVSGTGESDPMMIGLRRGTYVLYFKEHRGMDNQDQADFLFQFCTKLEVSATQCCVDGMGIGAAVVSRMEKTWGFWGINRFLANNDPVFSFEFADKYTELHWVIKELLAFNALSMEWNQDLIRDMRERQYVVMTGTSKIKTEPKKAHRKRTGHSPDALDTLIYLFSDFRIDVLRRGQSLKKAADVANPATKPWISNHPKKTNVSRKIMSEVLKQPSLAEMMLGNINTQQR